MLTPLSKFGVVARIAKESAHESKSLNFDLNINDLVCTIF